MFYTYIKVTGNTINNCNDTVFLCFKTNILIFNNTFLELTLFVDKPTKRIKKFWKCKQQKVCKKQFGKILCIKWNERERAFESKVHEKRHRQSKQENEKNPEYNSRELKHS